MTISLGTKEIQYIVLSFVCLLFWVALIRSKEIVSVGYLFYLVAALASTIILILFIILDLIT